MASVADRIKNKLRRMFLQNTTKIRGAIPVAIVGSGHISATHLSGYLESGYAYPAALCDVNPNALAGAMSKFGSIQGYIDIERMLAEVQPQIVSICTWPQSHLEIVEHAVRAGVRGILCEKPLTLRVDEANAMKDLCDKKGVKLGGAHQYRFHDAFRAAARAVESGLLGKSLRITGCIKSTLANNGPHLVDAVRFILGDRKLIRVKCQCVRHKQEINRGYPAEDSAESLLEFEGDAQVTLSTGDAAPDFFEINIKGDQGSLKVSPRGLSGNVGVPDIKTDGKHSHPRMFREFTEWVCNKRDSFAANGAASVASVEAVLALYESAKTGEYVSLPLANRGDVIKQLYASDSSDPPAPERVAEGLKAGDRPRLAVEGGQPTVRKWFSQSAIIGNAEVKSVSRVVRSGILGSTGGTQVKAFEADMAKMYGGTAVSSTSGTAALHVALATINPDPGSEVITTPVTDMGSIIPILACNCLPVFADVDPTTGNMTAASIASKITERTKAVILVHLFGRPADVHAIKKLLSAKGIALIEDCSQSHYADVQGGKVGSVGDFACFSFQQSKQITCGDGGVTIVHRPELVERARLFIDKGWNRSGSDRAHLFFGMNYRMTEMQAAVAREQLKRLPGLISSRRRSAESLHAQLKGVEGITLPTDVLGSNSSWWIFHLMVNEGCFGLSAATISGLLAAEGIKAKNGYLPRPMFDERVLRARQTYGQSGYPLTQYGYIDPEISDYPGTEGFLRNSILISWASAINETTVTQIATAIRKVFSALAQKSSPAVRERNERMSEEHVS